MSKTFTRSKGAAAIAFVGAIVFSLALLNLPNVRSYRQLIFVESAFHGNIGRMKLLLFLGADANDFECSGVRCRTPLIAAAEAGQYEAARTLLARGANVNKKMKRGQTALMFVSYHGHTELVKLLLASGADVNGDFEGDTALTWAKLKGHAEIADLLIAAGAVR